MWPARDVVGEYAPLEQVRGVVRVCGQGCGGGVCPLEQPRVRGVVMLAQRGDGNGMDGMERCGEGKGGGRT